MSRSRWLLLLSLAFLLGSWLAHARKYEARLLEKTLLHEGRERTYHVFLPKGFDSQKPVPLVLALHGGGGSGARFDRSTLGQMSREADARKWVLVYPEGIAKGWNDGRELKSWRDRQRKNVNDVDFIASLVKTLEQNFNIDRQRVFATGISNGGFMSFRLAVARPDLFAAIAPVTANLTRQMESEEPAVPISVLILNGTEDPLVPYAGGQVRVLGQDRGEILSTEKTVKWWATKNGCSEKPSVVDLPDNAPSDGTNTTVESYSSCANDTEVVLYRIEGGGHTWPGGKQYLPEFAIGRVSRDFQAAKVIFDFFERHRRSREIQPN